MGYPEWILCFILAIFIAWWIAELMIWLLGVDL